jgi:hypothetical protein
MQIFVPMMHFILQEVAVGFLLWNAENIKQWSKEPHFNSIFAIELNLK